MHSLAFDIVAASLKLRDQRPIVLQLFSLVSPLVEYSNNQDDIPDNSPTSAHSRDRSSSI